MPTYVPATTSLLGGTDMRSGILCVAAVLLIASACSQGQQLPLRPPTQSDGSPTATSSPSLQPTDPPSVDATDSPSPTTLETSMPAPPASAQEARVVRVTDGDTVVLGGIDSGEVDSATGGRKSRLIGVDTPEVFSGTDCYGPEASAFTKRELLDTQVLVDFDVDRTDRYGRALVYIWKTDATRTFFNARLVSEGYALQMTVPPNVRYADLFSEVLVGARAADRGLWAGCPTEPEGRTEPLRTQTPTAPPPSSRGGNCHPSYPDHCIPPAPPDLDCVDVPYKDFRVRHDVPDPDPHGFDGNDDDGLGCES